MLRRRRPEGDLFIGQPSHAWLSGQIARAWGNETFGSFAPWEEVCLAAAQHDIGMTDFDRAPPLDPKTRLPQTFLDMDRRTHLDIWSQAPEKVMPQCRYAALLVSMHGTGLYEHVDAAKEPDRVRELIEDYRDDQRRFQQDLIAELQSDPLYRDAADERNLARNKRLIQVWDLMSLRICMGFESEMVERVPVADGDLPLFMGSDATGLEVMLDPWPFSDEAVRLVCEGRLLDGSFGDEREMQAALTNAPWVTLAFDLRPRVTAV